VDSLLQLLQPELEGLFFNPQKRLFVGYLLAAFAIGLVWLIYNQRQSLHQARSQLTSRKLWWSSSAKADYQLLIFNRLLFRGMAPALLAKLTVAGWLFNFLEQHFNRPSIGDPLLPNSVVAICFTLFLMLLDDFARYLVHRLMHRVPMLWVFHQVHHSARVLTPLTVLRSHPVEGVLFAVRSSLVQGISIALFVYFFPTQVDLVSVLGASVFAFVFNVAGSNLRHSPVPIRYWQWLERWLISPAQHQIHHSIEKRHYDKNFGAMLAVWDRWFGTLAHSENNQQQLRFGVTEREEASEQRLTSLLLKPFLQFFRQLKRYFYKFKKPTNTLT